MAHDKNTIHVSHYKDSPTWRSAVTPEDRSWLLFIDVGGSPHLYLASDTQDGEGRTVTTYVPCVRAMLRADVEAGAAPSPPIDTEGFTITVTPQDDSVHPWTARSTRASLARVGKTAKDAILGALDEIVHEDAAALAL